MKRRHLTLTTLAVALGSVWPSESVRADLFRDVGFGLGYAGFNIEADHNILSGGTDFLINRNLVGNTLDFGPLDLRVAGPISLQASSSRRGVSQFEVSFRTAMDRDSANVPLSYALDYDVGGQETQVTGTLLIDATASLNEFGFYDLDVMYSSRQDVDRHGRFSESEDQFDFDIGPISMSGNIFADALALVTDPLFTATGQFNPFSSFSGPDSLTALITDPDRLALRQLADGSPRIDESLIALFNSMGGVDMGGGPNGNAEADRRSFARVVPEPAVIVLLLAGIPAVLRRPSSTTRRKVSPAGTS